MAWGLGPYSRPRAQFFPIRTSRPVNNIYVRGCCVRLPDLDCPDANRHEAAANQQTAAAPPTYAAVDKSKKKSKRKKEEKFPGNSVVDKSQTRKQSDDTYAQVDKSKNLLRRYGCGFVHVFLDLNASFRSGEVKQEESLQEGVNVT